MVHLHYILLWHSEVLISRSFAKNKKTTVLLMRKGIQICKNLSAVLSALRTIIDWIFYKLDDRRTFWSPSSSSTCQLIIAPIGTRRSKGRAKSRNTFIDNWVCDQIIRGSRVGWFKTRADFLLWNGWERFFGKDGLGRIGRKRNENVMRVISSGAENMMRMHWSLCSTL